MSGETNLDRLLRSMSAQLMDDVYVFATVPEVPPAISPVMQFHEAEGITLILLRSQAETLDLAYEFPSRMITLNIHSSLDAVGFMARIATALAAKGMGVNPVAGFYHDHLFVPEDRAEDAMQVLAGFAAETGDKL